MPARKGCFVPKCPNTSIKNPLKIFVSVPKAPKIRAKWFSAARRDITVVSPTSAMYCCEDHFDLEKDMENYMEYKLSKVKARMNPTIVPHKFVCQPGRSLVTKPRLLSEKRARKKEMLAYLHQSEETMVLEQEQEHVSEPSTSFITFPIMCDKVCQTKLTHFRSKYVQASPKLEKNRNRSTTYIIPNASRAVAKASQHTSTTDFSRATMETSDSDFYPPNQSSQNTEDSEIDRLYTIKTEQGNIVEIVYDN